MYCQNCGAENLDSSKFCAKCGKPLMQNMQVKQKKKGFNFLYLVPVLVIVIAVGVYFIFFHTSDSAKKGIYTPGTYTAMAEGFGGNVQVKATFDANNITNVEIDAPEETPTIGGAAIEVLKEQILNMQSSDIDGVSGATHTSNGVKAAMKDCIKQAENQ